MRKKILVLASTFPISDNDIQPEFIKRLCLELSEYSHVTVLLPGAPGASGREYIGNIEIIRFRYFFKNFELLTYGSGILSNLKEHKLKWFLVPFFLISQLTATVKLINKQHFDVIHAHWIFPQGLIAAIGSSFYKTPPPLLVTSHGADLFALNNYILLKLKKWVLNKAKHITVVSDAMEGYCENTLGILHSKISVMSMGVDLEKTFTPDRAVQEKRQIVFVGRLVDKKGLSYLIEAMPIILENQPDTLLNIIGDGSLKQQLVQQVKKLKIEASVIFHGAIKNSKIPNILRICSIAVTPSIITKGGDQEGLGLVILEALGCGCVVVASDIPAIRTIISEGKNGLLVPQKNHFVLAEKIILLLKNEEMREELSKNGRHLILKKYDWKNVGKNYANLLNNLAVKSV